MRRVTVKWDRDHSRTAFAVLLAIIITAGLAVFATGCTDAEGDAVSRSNGVAAMAGGAALEAQATSTSVSWNGVNGADKNCAQGGTLHWILTTGGNADIVSGSLTVTFQGGGSQTVDGQFPGGGGGAMHFYTTGDSPVTAAVANYSYEGTQNNVVLTISSSVCNTTTTTEPPTTTTTTTTEPPTTTAPPTTAPPTTAPPTTAPPTTAPPTTAPPTTVLPTTTTPTSEVTTTTTAPPTPTTLDEVTSTTAPSTTTSSTPNTTTGPATSVPTTGGVSTTQGGATTAPSVSLIHTGGGGTAGVGTGHWALMILAGCLAVALGASAIAVRVRGK